MEAVKKKQMMKQEIDRERKYNKSDGYRGRQKKKELDWKKIKIQEKTTLKNENNNKIM